MSNVIKIDSEPSGLSDARTVAAADAVLTVEEVASELRCSKAHVYNAINGRVSGVSALRVIQMGRRVLIRRSSLEIWKRQNERCGK
jgi:excisionase family DNA binding protein